MKVTVTLSSRDYDAGLFDLDGVLTRTARVHAAAWKKLFDGLLEQRATKAGKPRYDGVVSMPSWRIMCMPGSTSGTSSRCTSSRPITGSR